MTPLFFPLFGQIITEFEKQEPFDEQKLIGRAWIAPYRVFDGSSDICRIGFSRPFPVYVGPVYRELGHYFDQGSFQTVEGDIASVSIPARNGLQKVGEIIHVASHVLSDNQPFLVADEF